MLFAAGWVGWIGWSRLRSRGFERLPRAAAPGLLAVAAGLVVASAIVPAAVFPPNTPVPGPRPTSTATIAFERPNQGDSVDGDQVEVLLDLQGGTIVDATSTALAPDTGHIHLLLDGELVSMSEGVELVIDVGSLQPGEHALRAEFVAVDHAPFSPRVVATVMFRTGEPS